MIAKKTRKLHSEDVNPYIPNVIEILIIVVWWRGRSEGCNLKVRTAIIIQPEIEETSIRNKHVIKIFKDVLLNVRSLSVTISS